jgi:hypothetical protein
MNMKHKFNNYKEKAVIKEKANSLKTKKKERKQ